MDQKNANWKDAVNVVSAKLGDAALHDNENTFVASNYSVLKNERIFSAIVPSELGGGGWSHSDMCNFLREIAHTCGSTALALSMHQHLVSANVWKYKGGQGSEELLKRIASTQMVMVSTGAGDWLSSNGSIKRVEGGYRVTAEKNFASQAPVGDLLVTSARFIDPKLGQRVLHFGVPFKSEGVVIKENWNAMGMRGTGSCSVSLNDVFVPEASISLERPQGEFHPFWNVVLTVAMPLIMSVYLGIAEKAASIAIDSAKDKSDPQNPFLLGELYNSLTTARVLIEDMIRIANNFAFQPVNENGNNILARKTVAAQASVRTVQKAMEIVGGRSYLKQFQLERLFRDIVAVNFHPLPEKEQQVFTGRYLMGHKLLDFAIA